MAKEQINEYTQGIKSTSYLLDVDENNNSFKRVCIFFNDDNGVFINTENVNTRIEKEKEMLKALNE